jgi:hypothetical protein
MQFTPDNRARLRATVFGKTAAGRAEVSQRSAGLTARQRAVLILLDGQKPLGEIGTWLGEDDMLAAVEILLRKGLAGITAQPVSTLGPGSLVDTAPAVSAARQLMAAAARKHLGLLAADLLHRIEQARDHSQLAAVVGLWHVSLRESKTGKPCAEGLLAQARALLA